MTTEPSRSPDDPSPAPSAETSAQEDLSFLARPDELADWRMTLAYEAAERAGALAALPGSLPEVAERCGLDEGALRAVFGQLSAWRIVVRDEQGHYRRGPKAPRPPHDAILMRHASTIRRWAALLEPRLRDRCAAPGSGHAAPPPPRMEPNLLAINARRLTVPMVDAVLQLFPHATRVLDLGGGHGEHSLELARRGLEPTMQDLPEVIRIAERRGRLGRAGVELFAGDLHTTLASGPFDLVLCAAVTNMFDGPRNLDLYRRLRSVLAPGGGLAIVSYMRGRDEVTASFGLQMLVWTEGGDAHSVDDYRGWLAQAGYGPVEIRELDHPPQTIVTCPLSP